MPILGPYYYGKHQWDDYLLDMLRTIKSGNAVSESIRLKREAFDVVTEQVDQLRQHAEQFRHIEETLKSGFQELRAEFEWASL